jgi:Transposase, Mutator family
MRRAAAAFDGAGDAITKFEAFLGSVVIQVGCQCVISAVSKSEVSRLGEEIDERVGAFLTRLTEDEWLYLWIDATYTKARKAAQGKPLYDGGQLIDPQHVAYRIQLTASATNRN